MRKMASIRKILDIKKIENADKICIYLVDGWQIIDEVNKYKINDFVIMLEIDSWVPNALAPFLSKGKVPREFNGIQGEKLKTVKLRGALSQGLLLPVSVLPENYLYEEGDDVSEILGVQKYEVDNTTQSGKSVSNWPSIVPKTDQERLQNLKSVFESKIKGQVFEITEKLDGSSATYYIDADGIYHVMSRNVDLARDENNLWWKMSAKYNIEEMMLRLWLDPEFREEFNKGFAIRGEIVGPGVNGNKLQLTEHDFYVFDLWEPIDGYCPPKERHLIVNVLGLKHVPLHHKLMTFSGTFEQLLESANGQSVLNPNVKREGLVFKSEDGQFTFKIVSNEWLLEFKE